MTTDRDRIVAANTWNVMWIENLIQDLESTKTRFERWERLGSEAQEVIDDFITRLECLKTDYQIKEEI